DNHHETHRIGPLVCCGWSDRGQGWLLQATWHLLAAAPDWLRWNASKLAWMAGSAIRKVAPRLGIERPPSAAPCSMTTTASAIAGSTKKRGLSSIIGAPFVACQNDEASQAESTSW